MHVIQLRGPWTYQVLERAESAGKSEPSPVASQPLPSGVVTMPCDWGQSLGNDFRGRVRYVRRFHRPTGLSPSTRVGLVLEQVDPIAAVTLNQQLLGQASLAAGRAEWDITSLLLPFNELQIDIELLPATADRQTISRPGREHLPGGLIGAVQLVIVE